MPRTVVLYLYLDAPPGCSTPLGTIYDPAGVHRGWRPVYVGRTIRPLQERDGEHRRRYSTPFDKAYTKNSTMQLVTLEQKEASATEANAREAHYIALYKTDTSPGLNIIKRAGGQTLTSCTYSWYGEMEVALDLFFDQYSHVNVPARYKCCTTHIPLGYQLDHIRQGKISVPEAGMRRLREEMHFMFSMRNLYTHVRRAQMPDMPDPWGVQTTPAGELLAASIRRLLAVVAERHPGWVRAVPPGGLVPFGKMPLDVKTRYLADRQKALGKRKR
jgi:hypothetical protein